MKKQIQEFFNRPGINKSGICNEAGITQQYLNRILRSTQPITDSFLSKIIPVLKTYGFEAMGDDGDLAHVEEDELLEDFTILINAWVSLDERQVSQLAESLCKLARSEFQKSASNPIKEFELFKKWWDFMDEDCTSYRTEYTEDEQYKLFTQFIAENQ